MTLELFINRMHPMTRGKENPLEPGYLHIQLVNKDHSDFEEILAKSPGVHPFDVEDFIDSSNNPETIEKLKRFGFFQSVEQKIHSEDQILTVEEVKPGMQLFLRQNDEVMGEITITSEPYKEENDWKVDCEEIGSDRERSYIFFSDNGVTPYQNGYWNAWNWLQKPEKLVAIFRNEARENLSTLQGMLDEYFDGGYGSSLTSEKQSFVAAKARLFVFAWTRGRLVRKGVIDRNHMSTRGEVYKDLEQEFEVESFEEVSSSLNNLSLTNYKKAGLERRAWSLAEKVLEKTEKL